jgi:hypothetical protein
MTTIGCSSTYIPRPGRRVSAILVEGSPAYVRDGKRYASGAFGGNLEEAVRGNAQAEEYAKEYKTELVAGTTTAMFGVAGMAGGMFTVGLGAASSNRSLPVTGVIIASVGFIVYATGLGVKEGAARHLYDAVNAYNDALPPLPP